VDVGNGEVEAPPEGTRVRFKSAESARLSGIETVTAGEGDSSAALAVVGRIVPDASRMATVNARVPGVIRSIDLDVGARVAKGDAMATIESAQLGGAQSRLRASQARAVAARENLAREEALAGLGVSSARAVQEARRDAEEAEADLAAAGSELGVIGHVSSEGRYRLVAPLAGVVTERHGSIGQVVHEDESLFVIVDASSVWAELDVPEAAAASVAVGDLARIQSTSLPGREFDGAISYVAPAVDSATRTVKARVAIANPEGLLRANMFIRGWIDVPHEARTSMVPIDAVHRIGDVEMVFVRLDDASFETRRVTTGQRRDALVPVVRGLQPGEQVATTGSFLLKTETMKGSIGSGCCEID
jgi:cobalt-zinc-cadmium efflux system membrane fusion protein